MNYTYTYKTPDAFDDMIMGCSGEYLTALLFKDTKDSSKLYDNCEEKFLPIFGETARWLDIYFSGKIPEFIPNYKIENQTPFKKQVTDIMKKIPYGKTVTYGNIAKQIASERNLKKMSAQAVGGAVGSNPICIIIPCHRVVGAGGALTGYGGGIKNKAALLALEKNMHY